MMRMFTTGPLKMADTHSAYSELYVDLDKKRRASDGQMIVPVRYLFHGEKNFAGFGWYIVDSLRGANSPVLHYPDGIAFVRWQLNARYTQCGMLDVPIRYSKLDSVEYHLNGKLHRKDGPAVSKPDHKIWYKYGERHRVGGPAEEFGLGSITYIRWYINGLLHRVNGPANTEIKLKVKLSSDCKYKNKHKCYWHFMGEQIPKDIVRFDHGKPLLEPFDKHAVVEATLWNRDYGKIVQIIHSTNRMPSEMEIYKILTGNDW